MLLSFQTTVAESPDRRIESAARQARSTRITPLNGSGNDNTLDLEASLDRMPCRR